jgi:hypothetical protein
MRVRALISSSNQGGRMFDFDDDADQEIDDLKKEARSARKWAKNDRLADGDPDKITDDGDEDDEEI